jgi:hypothetical protein
MGCSSLAEVTIPNTVTSIGSEAFRDCSSLSTITLPEQITQISYRTFQGCSSLTSIVIPELVKSIWGEAFYMCSNLKSVVIGSSVTNITNYSFMGCPAIRTVICKPTTPPVFNDESYNFEVYSDAVLYVPAGCTSAYQNAEVWRKFKNIAEEGQDVKQCATPVITFADGNLHFYCETAGAECQYTLTTNDTQTSFKPAKSNTVALYSCYNITAYAMADGYKNSDQVKATLYWTKDNANVDTNINTTETRGIMTTFSDGLLTVSGLHNQETVKFYTTNGVLLHTATAQDGKASFAVGAGTSVVVVGIGSDSFKVICQ